MRMKTLVYILNDCYKFSIRFKISEKFNVKTWNDSFSNQNYQVDDSVTKYVICLFILIELAEL